MLFIASLKESYQNVCMLHEYNTIHYWYYHFPHLCPIYECKTRRMYGVYDVTHVYVLNAIHIQ